VASTCELYVGQHVSWGAWPIQITWTSRTFCRWNEWDLTWNLLKSLELFACICPTLSKIHSTGIWVKKKTSSIYLEFWNRVNFQIPWYNKRKRSRNVLVPIDSLLDKALLLASQADSPWKAQTSCRDRVVALKGSTVEKGPKACKIRRTKEISRNCLGKGLQNSHLQNLLDLRDFD